MTTFDRYLLRRFWHVFGIGFFATVGLYVVFDGFTNIDEFQAQAKNDGPFSLLSRMAEFYGYQSLVIFDLVAPILTVVATMVVFAMLQKNREIHPVLSAGVPTYRLLWPMLLGSLSVNAALMLNQELVLPACASKLLQQFGADGQEGQAVQSRRDFATHIEVSGKRLFLNQQKLTGAEFLLPSPEITAEITTLQADEAIYRRKTSRHPAGWHLKNALPPMNELRLTPAGRKIVVPLEADGELFVVTDVGSEQLIGSTAAFRYQSTADLVERIRHPAHTVMAMRAQSLHFHERLTRPIGNLLAVCLAVPLVMRKEHFSLIANLAMCAGVMIVLLVLGQAAQHLGRINFVSQDLAIWLPIIFSGGLAAWYSDQVLT